VAGLDPGAGVSPSGGARRIPPAGVLRGVVVALLVYALILLIGGGAASSLEPGEIGELDSTYWLVIVASAVGAAAGTAAGAWQARAGGVSAPIVALLAAAVAVIVAGVLLTRANGGTSDTGDALIYLAHPVGAAVGAVLYGRRWLAQVA